jgi:mRNA-degrading endonuclease RelE of RelBE toxin-antitoxin system
VNIQFTPRATRDYAALPSRLQRAIDKQLDLLRDRPENLRHPSIQAKKYIEAGHDVWQGRVNRNYRFYFEIAEDTYRIIRIIPHPK